MEANRSVSQAINLSVNQSISQSINQSVNPSICQSVSQYVGHICPFSFSSGELIHLFIDPFIHVILNCSSRESHSGLHDQGKASAFSLGKNISPSSRRVEMNNAPLSEGDWKSGQWRSGYSVGRSAFSKALVNSLESTKIPYLRIAQLPVLAQNCWPAMKKRQ